MISKLQSNHRLPEDVSEREYAMRDAAQLFTKICRKHLGIPSLDVMPGDVHFYGVTIDGIKRALREAYDSALASSLGEQRVDIANGFEMFDYYEVNGVAEFSEPYGQKYCEIVPDDEAHFWSLYGHIPNAETICIGNFLSREAAETVYARITGTQYYEEG